MPSFPRGIPFPDHGQILAQTRFLCRQMYSSQNPLSYFIYGDEMRDLNEAWDKKGPENWGPFLLTGDLGAALGLFGPFCGGGIFGRLIPFNGFGLIDQGLCQDFDTWVTGMIFSPSLTESSRSAMSFSFSLNEHRCDPTAGLPIAFLSIHRWWARCRAG